MKVLQILHTDETGGIRTLANMVAGGLLELGHSVETVFIYRDSSLSRARKLGSALSAGWELFRSTADVVVTYQATASILAGTAGRLGRSRLRVVHQTAVPEVTAWPLRIGDKLVGSLGGYSANVMNSRTTMGCFASYPARYRKHAVLIEHGIVPATPDLNRQATRERFNLPDRAPLLLNVGRLVDQKNQAVVVRALREVPEAVFAIAGGGELKSAYRLAAKKEGVEDRVFFLGDLSPRDVGNLLAAADVFVFTSTWETFGLAGGEAAIAGLPIVASDIPVLREVLVTGKDAPVRFAAPQSVMEWAAAINELLKSRPSTERYAAEMADRFSRKRMIEKYAALLET